MSRIAKAKPWVVFPVEYLPLCPLLDYCCSRGGGGEAGSDPAPRVGAGPSLLLILLLLSSEGANCLIYLFISQS